MSITQKHFLSLFSAPYTFVLLPDNDTAKYSPQTFYSTEVPEQLEGMGLFFTPNTLDGIIHPPATTPRSQASVTHLHSLYVDTDNGDIANLRPAYTYLGDPHIIVETSPTRYHVYWLIEPLPATPTNIAKWRQVQAYLAALDPLYDQAVARDYARVLRLPGSIHYKRPEAPHSVSVTRLADPIAKVDITALKLHAEDKPHTQYTYPKHQIPEGSRHNELMRYLGHTAKYILDPQALYIAAQGFLHTYCEAPDYPENELRAQVEYVHRQRIETISEAYLAPQEEAPDTSHLTQAPGLMGQMVDELLHKATNPVPEYAVAAALAMLSGIKLEYVRAAYRLTPPADYILALGRTGSGKSYPRGATLSVLSRVLKTRKPAIQELRSTKGLHYDLQKRKAHSAVLINDEAHHLLKYMTSSNNTGPLYDVVPYLLKIYSMYDVPAYDPGSIVSSDKLAPLEYPALMLLGLGVSSEALDFQALQSGMLNRFLVLTNTKEHIQELEFDQAPLLTDSYSFEQRLSELIRGYELAKLDSESNWALIPVDSAAQDALRAYHRLIQERSTTETRTMYYARAVEHAMRIATIAACEDSITGEIMDWSITFVDACLIASSPKAELTGSKFSDDYEALLQILASKGKRSIRDLVTNHAKRFQTSKYLKELLNHGLESGEIERETSGKRILYYLSNPLNNT